MKKNGHHPSGRQRWYCSICRYSTTSTDQRQQRAKQFHEFLSYVTGTMTRRQLITTSPTTWDRTHAWCWDTRPTWPQTGEIHDQVFIDGTYIGYNWCVLTAVCYQGVIAYQLCNRENKEAYRALLNQIPAPVIVTTDGDKGALAAIKSCWPQTRIQRCLVHVQRNIRRVTTSRPKTVQHKALYQLGLNLTKVTTAEQARAWEKALFAFHELYDSWLKERTYRDHVHTIPGFVSANQQWWYTHRDTRRIVSALDRYVKSGVLFTYLDPTIAVTTPIASTTNRLEGGTNAVLKAFLHTHRGLSEPRMLTAIDYFLYSRSVDPQPLETFMTNTITTPSPRPEQSHEGPAQIDSHINHQAPWEDGLTIRKGWLRN